MDKLQKEFESFARKVQDYSSKISQDNLRKAFEFGRRVHEGQKRFSGAPVMAHCLESAKLLASLKVDEETLIAALLQEVIDYTDNTIADIERDFGKPIANLVSGFKKIGTVRASIEEDDVETLRKMFLVMAKDLRVVLIKLADRLHNMQTLEFVKKEKRKRIASETLDIYVPIASRLGVYRFRSTLEDLCFKFLNEEEYTNIKEELKALGKRRKNAISEIKESVEDFIQDELGFEVEVKGRFKNIYSIYKKLKQKGRTEVGDIQDIFALRIILPSKLNKDGSENVEDLYNLISSIHRKWTPLRGRFKDYVSFPKPNGYRSLHTTVVGLAKHSSKEPVEIQIRTENMNDEAEYGIAAHWLYKKSKGSLEANDKDDKLAADKQRAHVEWIKSLEKVSTKSEGQNDEDVLNELKIDLFEDRIFVFTPNGDARDFPKGSTPIDFAYGVHSDLGERCFLAKASERIVPLDYEMENGDVIEIQTKTGGHPKLEWLSFVKTSNAKSKIKNFFRNFDREQHLKDGRAILNEKLEQFGQDLLDPKFSILRNYEKRDLGLKQREDLVKQVGNGKMLPYTVIKKVFSVRELMGDEYVNEHERIKKEEAIAGAQKMEPANISDVSKYIMVGGEIGLPTKIAACCKPDFGQPIVGYVTRGRAITIHKKGCNVFEQMDPVRYISARWI